MSPEQWRNERLDHRADIYALGVLAYQCLTGVLPFRATSAIEYLLLHTEQRAPELPSTFDPKLRAALVRALAKEKGQRYASALDFAAAVRAASLPKTRAQLPRARVTPWLVAGPPPLADLLSVYKAAGAGEERFALLAFLRSLARWIGVTALAASASLGPRLVPGADNLRRRSLTLRDWLELAETVCQPFNTRPEDFPIPELARWFDSGRGSRAQLTALAGLCAEGGEVTSADVALLSGLLESLEFICSYGLIVEDDSASVLLADGDGATLFSLSPLVANLSATPGAPRELFVADGVGADSGHSKMIAEPSGFVTSSETLPAWLQASFGLSAMPLVREAEIERAPYRGLARFGREDAGVFFGRNRDIQALYNRVLAQPFVALTGPSGSGKSSLIYAGLLARLSSEWSVASLRPATFPLSALTASIAMLPPAIGNLESDIDAVIEWLEAERRQLLVVVDQAEELVTLAKTEEANAFVDILMRLVQHARIRVLITIRDDFIGRATELRGWSQHLAGGLLLVSAPSREELGNMLRGPAERVGLAFDDDSVVDEMVSGVEGQAGALPLLSFAASRLWSARDVGRGMLTRAAYEQMGGVVGALAQYAEEVLAALPTQQQAVVRQLFRRLVTGSGTRSVVLRGELAANKAELRVLEHLVASRLIVASEGEDGREYLSIIHETLLTRWPRLQRWRDEDSAGLRFRDELRSAVASWEEHSKEPSYLWRGAALRNLEGWRESWSDSLSPRELAFADASAAEVSRVGRRRRYLIGGALATLLVASAVLLLLNRRAEESRATAERSRQSAEDTITDSLASRGFAELVAERRRRALVYLHAAYARGRDTPGIRIALVKAAEGIDALIEEEQVYEGAARVITGFAEKRFFSVSADAPTWTWEWSRERGFVRLGELRHGTPHFAQLADGGEVAATFGARRLKIWSYDGTLKADVEHSLQTQVLLFTEDTKRILTGWFDAVAVHNLKGKQLRTIGKQAGIANVIGLAFADNERILISVLATGHLRFYNFADGALLHDIELKARPTAMRVAADEKHVLFGLGDGRLVSVEIASGRIVRERKVHDDPLYVWFYPDKSRLIVNGTNGVLRIIDAATLRDVATFGNGRGRIIGMLSPARNFIISVETTRFTIWDPDNFLELRSVDVGRVIDSYMVTPDDSAVIVGSTDGTFSVWDPSGRDAVTIFREHKTSDSHGSIASAWHAAFSPDASLVASFDGKQILLWKPDSGKVVKRFELNSSVPFGMPRLQFSRDGKTLLAVFDRQVVTYDLASGLRTRRLTRDVLSGALVWGPEGLVGASTGAYPDIKSFLNVWDSESDRLVAERPTTSIVFDVEFLDDSGLLYCTGSEIGLWDFRIDEIRWSHSTSNCDDIALSPDGLVTSSGSGGFIQIRSAASGEIVRQIPSPTVFHTAVAFAAQDGLLATASVDNQVHIWAPESNTPVAVLSGHTTGIRAIQFAASGERLLSLDNEGNIIIWKLPRETRTAEELGKFIEDNVGFELVGAEVVPRAREKQAVAMSLKDSATASTPAEDDL